MATKQSLDQLRSLETEINKQFTNVRQTRSVQETEPKFGLDELRQWDEKLRTNMNQFREVSAQFSNDIQNMVNHIKSMSMAEIQSKSERFKSEIDSFLSEKFKDLDGKEYYSSEGLELLSEKVEEFRSELVNDLDIFRENIEQIEEYAGISERGKIVS